MKRKLILLLIIISSCTTNKVVNLHGISQIDKLSDKLELNASNKNDIINILGPPSTISTFDDAIWIYIERQENSGSIFKLGNKKLVKNNILIVQLDDRGVLKKKNFYNLNDMNKYQFSEAITESGYEKNSYVYSLLTSLREKINSPVKRKRSD